MSEELENATSMDKVSSSVEELKNKLVELSKQLDEAEKQKKAANVSFNSHIKDLKEEVKMTLQLLKQMEEGNNE